MKAKEIATAEKPENWSNLPPELDAAVDEAHAQVAAGHYYTPEEAKARGRETIRKAVERRKLEKGC